MSRPGSHDEGSKTVTRTKTGPAGADESRFFDDVRATTPLNGSPPQSGSVRSDSRTKAEQMLHRRPRPARFGFSRIFGLRGISLRTLRRLRLERQPRRDPQGRLSALPGVQDEGHDRPARHPPTRFSASRPPRRKPPATSSSNAASSRHRELHPGNTLGPARNRD